MFFQFGQMPGKKYFHSTVIIATCLSIFSAASADQRVLLTIAEAEDLALQNEPGFSALQASAEALRERSIAAAALPDPMLRVGLNNFPIQSGGFTTEGMTNGAIGLRQTFPAGKTRSIDTRRYEFLAGEMNESAAARERNVLTAARGAWLDLYYWGRAHELIMESRPFFDDLATITRSLYAVGRKTQQDVFRAELELSRLDDRLIEIESRRSRAQAALGEWIGGDARRPVARKLPDWDQVPAFESLQTTLLQHPLMRGADAKIEARTAGVDLAKERSKPSWALDLGYSYRDGSLPSGEPRSDFISVGVTIGLPMLRKKSVDSTISAALQERSAARSSREQTLRSLQNQLAAEYAQWQDLTRRLALYNDRILLQARNHAEASLLSYQSDKGDFADVMRGYIDDLNTRIDHVRLQTERARSYAMLANLGGIPQ